MKQANLLAGFVVVVAITLVAYIGIYKINWDKGESSTSEGTQVSADSGRDIFSYVPADTLFFFGGLSTTPFEETLNAMNPGNEWMQHADWSDQLSDEEKAKLPPAAVMINGIMNKYMELLKEPKTAASKLGIGDNLDAVSYSIGFIPVLRFKLDDTKAFTILIDDIEKQEKIVSTKTTAGDINLRSYSFDIEEDGSPSGSQLIIGSNNQYAIFSLSTKIENEAAHNLIVGTNKPVSALDAGTTLGSIKDKYGFHPAYIGFINHKEIMKGITGDGNGEFGRMLDTVINMANKAKAEAAMPADKSDTKESPEASQNENPLDAIRTAECQKELQAMVASWPQTVFGYTKMELASTPKLMEARMVIEGTDMPFMKDMQAIRGYIPKVLKDVNQHPVFGVGLGINVDGLSPFVAKATQGFTSKQYQCDFLKQAKQNLLQSNPAMALGMMSGMAGGVQGVSITVLDVEGNFDVTQPGAIPDIKSIDALITISSSNPQQLLMMVANFQPGMPPIQLPPDGTPIDLPVPLPIPALSQMKLALKGSHIVAYVGEKATNIANTLGKEQIQPSGIFAINMDFGKYMSLIASAAKSAVSADPGNQNAALSEKDQAMLDAMAKTKMQFVETLDIENEGIAFDIKMETN